MSKYFITFISVTLYTNEHKYGITILLQNAWFKKVLCTNKHHTLVKYGEIAIIANKKL